VALVGLTIGAGAGLLLIQAPAISEAVKAPDSSDSSFPCQAGHIVDADTFDCIGGPRIRVAGINANERDGRCNSGAPCVDVPETVARAELARLIEGQTLQCEANGTTYNRVAAFCRRHDGVDVSCAMVESGTVARWNRHWNGHRCP